MNLGEIQTCAVVTLVFCVKSNMVGGGGGVERGSITFS